MSSRYTLSMGRALDLQEWALKETRAKKILNTVPQLRSKAKPGIYASYKIDKNELDGKIDYPDVGIATIYGVFKDGKSKILGEIRAYNWEVIWLSTHTYDEVDTLDNWWKLIHEEYQKLQKASQRGMRRFYLLKKKATCL